MKIFKLLDELLRTLVPAILLGLIGFGVWIGVQKFYPLLALRQELQQKEEQLAQMAVDLEVSNQEIERLDTALRLLKVDHRVAQMVVLDQWRRPDEIVMTQVAFAEVDDQGQLLDGYKTFTIEGDVVYIDSWVAKFMDEHVENGVPLRSTSICLFRRLFGEHQRPRDGFALDAVGSQPAAYSSGSEMSSLQRDIWSHFWEYANTPDRAQQVGLRALQGEAPSIRLVKGKVYWVFLRASDGLTIKVTDQAPPSASAPEYREVQPAGYHQAAGH